MDGWNTSFRLGWPIFQVVQPKKNVKETKPETETFHPSDIKPYKVSTPPEPINTPVAYVHLPYKWTIHVGKYTSPMDPMC